MKSIDELRLASRVSDLILDAFDGLVDLPRGDVQGIAGALAMQIIKAVREAT